MRATKPLLTLAILLSFGGAYTSALLLNKHLSSSRGPAWLDALCESGTGGNVSCDKVLSSRWAWIPPKNDSDPEDTVRYPVAGIGVAYFTLLLVWWVFVGRPTYGSRGWHLLPLVFNGLGMFGSVGFIGLMAFDLDVWCPLCLATHVFNALLLVVNILLRPVAPPEASTAAPDQVIPVQQDSRHPSVRLALATIALGVMIVGTSNQGRQLKRLAAERQRMLAIIKDVQQNTETLVTMHLNTPAVDLKLRPDEAIRNDGPDRPTLVMWSDFECGYCRQFEIDLENQYLTSFGGQLRVVFRHYPLSPACNPYSKARMHPYSCKAAMMAEAARRLGGDEAFWKANGLLFHAQRVLGDIELPEFAARLGLDADEFVDTMRSEAVKQRIAEDVELGHAVGVSSTPTVFLEGRRVDPLARGVPSFWSMMAGTLRHDRLARQAEEAGRQGETATPGSPDPTAAP